MGLIPLFHHVEYILYAFYLSARVGGLFLVSPLFANATINASTRAILTMFMSILLGMVLWPQYFGESPRYVLQELQVNEQLSVVLITFTIMKELAVGFLIGFCFNLIFEALLLAGQMVSVMIGFSIAEIIDPVSGTSQSTVAQVFTLSASLIMLALDLHHVFLWAITRSFEFLPIGQYEMNQSLLQDVTHGTSRIFTYGLRVPAVPYVILFLLTMALGFMAKVMPEMNIFMVGFPLRILVGFYGLVFALRYFPDIFQRAFREFHNLVERVIVDLMIS